MADNRPFKHKHSRRSVDELHDWLCNQDQTTKLSDDYTVGDLVEDLDELLSQMWSDGIDARGEDA